MISVVLFEGHSNTRLQFRAFIFAAVRRSPFIILNILMLDNFHVDSRRATR